MKSKKITNAQGRKIGDFIAEGKQGIIPPSKVDGTSYTVHKNIPIKQISKTELDSLLRRIKGNPAAVSITPVKTVDETRSGKEFAKVCKLIKKNKTKEEIFEAMKNSEKWKVAHPQYREKTYEKALKATKEEEKYEKKIESAIRGLEKLSEDELIEAVTGYLSEKPKRTKQAYYLVAKYFLSLYHMIAFVTNGDIHLYKDGIYVSGGKELIEKEIERVLTNQLSNNFVNEVLGHIRRTTFIGKEGAIEPLWKICLENNILDLKDLTVSPHSPEFYFFSKMPVKYNPDADCPLFKEFLKQILREQKEIDTIQELFGYCLLKDYPIQKLIILLGEGGNGKSTLLNVLRKFLGAHNCSAVPLQQLAIDKFAGANLFSKMANICSDMSSRELTDITMFKLATGEDTISAERKFKDKFNFNNYAKMIFAANRLPLSAEESDAFFRRLLIIRFPFQFLEKRADKGLTAKLTTKEELSGILNFAIVGLKRLMEKGEFSSSVSLEETKIDYIRTASPTAAFVMDELISDSNSYIPKTELYSTFMGYCVDNKLPTPTSNAFNRELQKRIKVVEYKRLGVVDGEKVRINCWKGIKYRNITDNTDNTDTNASPTNDNTQQGDNSDDSGNRTLTDFETEDLT